MLHVLKSKNAKNASWIIGEQIFQMLISFFIGIFTARYLGPSNYGVLNYTASFVAFVTSIVTLGMDGVVIRKIIATPEKEGIIHSIMFSVLTGFLLPFSSTYFEDSTLNSHEILLVILFFCPQAHLYTLNVPSHKL